MAWINDKKITGVYSYGPQNRNSYAHIDGIGWRLIWNEHDCQSEAITVMASYACNSSRPVQIYEEDGKIKTMYVW